MGNTARDLGRATMECFVASALGKGDVDAIYDRCVCPVLKRLSVQPLRVDRLEHNEDIDNKIFNLLEAADFAVVDLTYARPSVYYEAGYACGKGKPVIYIARSDHFRARDEDPEGLLRVHFDLQMKNIVSWSAPNKAFRTRLERRLRYVLRPLLQQREEEAKLAEERSRFGRLSQSSQVTTLSSKATALLKARGFRIQTPGVGIGLRLGAPPAATAVAFRESGYTRQDVAVVCTASALKQLFQRIGSRGSWGFRSGPGQPATEIHYVVASLASAPRTRVAGALPRFQSLDDATFHHKYESDLRPDVDVYVHVIGGVKSETEFAGSFRSMIGQYRLERGA